MLIKNYNLLEDMIRRGLRGLESQISFNIVTEVHVGGGNLKTKNISSVCIE